MPQIRPVQILLATLIAAFVALPTHAQTVRRVPEDHPDIQSAVDACLNGDIVEVNDGIWTGSGTSVVEILNLSVTIRNATGASPVIDGESIRHGIILFGTAATTIALEGIEVRNGLAVLSGSGGALWANNPNATIELTGCLFADNTATGSGGAVHATAGIELDVLACEFLRNEAGMDGGGLSIDGEALLTGCILDDNVAAGSGGGINATGVLAIQNCGFDGNLASAGAAVTLSKSSIASMANSSICDCGPSPIEGRWTDLGGNDIQEFCPIPPIVVAADGSGDYTSIQDAVDAIEDGGTIEIRAGVYEFDTNSGERIDLGTKNVRLIGDGPTVTVIQGNASDIDTCGGAVIVSSPPDDGTALLELANVTIRRAGDRGGCGGDGAVALRRRDVLVRNCHFIENFGNVFGAAAIGVSDGSLRIDDSVFMSNHGSGVPIIGGASWYGEDFNGSLTLTRCDFQSNQAGRGILSSFGIKSLDVVDCVFTDNVGHSGGLVAASLCCSDASGGSACTFSGNRFENNTSEYALLALSVDYASASPLSFRDNIIRSNTIKNYYDNGWPMVQLSHGGTAGIQMEGNRICDSGEAPPLRIFGSLHDLGGNCVAPSCDDADGDGIPDQCQSVGDGVHQVPEEFPTIQAAVNHAGWGDVVEIGPGQWTGTNAAVIRLTDRPITIRGVAGAAATVIDGQEQRTCIEGGLFGPVTIEGVSLERGVETWGSRLLADLSAAAVSFDSCLMSTVGDSPDVDGWAITARGNLRLANCELTISDGDAGVWCAGMFDATNTLMTLADAYRGIDTRGGTIDGCDFIGHWSSDLIYALASDATSTLTISDSTFEGQAPGIRLNGGWGNVELRDCQFRDLVSSGTGGAIDLDNWFNSPPTHLLVTGCLFEGCQSELGGALHVVGQGAGTTVRVENSTFANCAASDGGGAIAFGSWNTPESLSVSDCLFRGNSTGNAGGAIASSDPISIENCTFENNVAIDIGGALHILHAGGAGTSSLSGSSFRENYALSAGGAVAVADADIDIQGGAFIGNTAQYGGAIWAIGSNVEAFGAAFTSNTAYARGGAMECLRSTASLDDVLVSDNRALAGAGGIQGLALSSIATRDSTYCSNIGDTPDVDHYDVDLSSSWSDLGGNTYGNACLGACPTDLNQDGVTSGLDLGLMFVAWGPCSGTCTADLNGDGVVGGPDLGLLFVGWGPCD